MELEYTFNGTTEQFMEVAMVYIARRVIKKEPYQWRVSVEGYNFLYLKDEVNKENTIAWIKAQVLPDNKTLLLVFLHESKLSEITPYWEHFYDELIRQGWIKSEDSVVIKKPSKPAMPSKGSLLEKWFEYYEAMKVSEMKCTLKQLAKESGFNYGYIRREYATWKKSRESVQI
jgi:hypothetical protein